MSCLSALSTESCINQGQIQFYRQTYFQGILTPESQKNILYFLFIFCPRGRIDKREEGCPAVNLITFKAAPYAPIGASSIRVAPEICFIQSIFRWGICICCFTSSGASAPYAPKRFWVYRLIVINLHYIPFGHSPDTAHSLACSPLKPKYHTILNQQI